MELNIYCLGPGTRIIQRLYWNWSGAFAPRKPVLNTSQHYAGPADGFVHVVQESIRGRFGVRVGLATIAGMRCQSLRGLSFRIVTCN